MYICILVDVRQSCRLPLRARPSCRSSRRGLLYVVHPIVRSVIVVLCPSSATSSADGSASKAGEKIRKEVILANHTVLEGCQKGDTFILFPCSSK